MLASSSVTSPNRFERAQAFAVQLRAKLPDVRVGLASMTDRVLPHLFPTLDQDVYSATLQRSIGIERPPPSRRSLTATDLRALAELGPQGFFPPTPERRIVVVLSDFETDPFSVLKLGSSLRRQRLELLFVHIWDREERIWGGLGDADYRPDPGSEDTVRRLAEAAAGRAFTEEEMPEAKQALRALLGSGARRPRWKESSRTELAPWLALAAVVPLGFVVWRRNLG